MNTIFQTAVTNGLFGILNGFSTVKSLVLSYVRVLVFNSKIEIYYSFIVSSTNIINPSLCLRSKNCTSTLDNILLLFYTYKCWTVDTFFPPYIEKEYMNEELSEFLHIYCKKNTKS